ncbi:hypothetical protein DFJ73DRAFT_611105, partial [Zopfochytrium polystomum]
ANGRQTIMIPIVMGGDDTSANLSKKWNKVESWSAQLAGLPAKIANLSENIHFVTTSGRATGYESSEILAWCFRSLQKGCDAYHAGFGEKVLFYGMLLEVTGDNPAHSMFCSHTGLQSTKPCRLCNVAWNKIKTSEMIASFASSPAESPDRFVRTSSHAKSVMLDLHHKFHAELISRAELETLLKDEGIKDPYFNLTFHQRNVADLRFNPLFGLVGEDPFFDGAPDCPTEILHCVQLGIIKYALRATVQSLSKPNRDILKSGIEGIDRTGLEKPPNGHALVVQYVGSLIGKDFKLFAQLAPFALVNIVDNKCLQLWKSIAEMTAILFVDEIDDLDCYIAELDASMDTFVRATLESDYVFEILKPKLHILRELPFYVKKFGPPKRFAAESFESFNKSIRMRIVGSNRQNPSRDTAKKFAEVSAARHIVSGGYF